MFANHFFGGGLFRHAQNRSGMGVVSNKWESIRSLCRLCIPLGYKNFKVQSFNHVTFSYLK